MKYNFYIEIAFQYKRRRWRDEEGNNFYVADGLVEVSFKYYFLGKDLLSHFFIVLQKCMRCELLCKEEVNFDNRKQEEVEILQKMYLYVSIV